MDSVFFFFLTVQTMKYESPVLLSMLGDRVGSEMNERIARLAECRGKKGGGWKKGDHKARKGKGSLNSSLKGNCTNSE